MDTPYIHTVANARFRGYERIAYPHKTPYAALQTVEFSRNRYLTRFRGRAVKIGYFSERVA